MLTHATSLASNPGYPICRSMDTGMATERTARGEFIRISASLLATNEALKTICPSPCRRFGATARQYSGAMRNGLAHSVRQGA
jgi:hypothetical protein